MKKFFRIKYFLLIYFSSHAAIVAQTAVAPSGSGTYTDPYLIASLDNLYWVSQNTASWDKYFKQTASIDASATSTWDGGQGFTPIGNGVTQFTGQYDGNNYSISNLKINRPSSNNVGLFGYAKSAKFFGISLTNLNITGNTYVGGLIGYNYNSDVYTASTTGNVTGQSDVGGLIGKNYFSSYYENSSSQCNVSGNQNVGGLIGYSYYGKIEECFTTGNISGTQSVGGFIGYAQSITDSNSYSFSNVTRTSGTNTYIGAFIGYLYSGSVSKCYSTGSVYYTGASDPTDKGFVGYDDWGTTYGNYWDSEVSNQTTATDATAKTTMEMKNAFTYTDASISPSAIWDFIGDPNGDTTPNNYWGINPNNNYGYPFLSWQGYSNYASTPSSGDGSSGNPFRIANLQNLYWLAQHIGYWTNSYYIKQTANIDASSTSGWNNGSGFMPLGNNAFGVFSANYDGQNYTINGLYINRPSEYYVGFFGTVSGTISNVALRNINISGNEYVGSIAGYVYSGNLSSCSSTGSVSASGNYAGGLVGSINYNATLTNTCSSCSVSGINYVGGLVGYTQSFTTVSKSFASGSVSGVDLIGGFSGVNKATVTDSYSRGNVTRTSGSSQTIGSFIGYNYSSVSKCYSTGRAIYSGTADPTDKGFIANNSGTYSHNFFDSEVSLQSTGTGAIGVKTSKMQRDSIFIANGWDFSTVWEIITPNVTYPTLRTNQESALPVELTFFSAEIKDDFIILTWETATEINNYGFEILRTTDKNLSPGWETIGFIEGGGNSSSIRNYSFIDRELTNGKIRYKLKQIDTDGRFTYSEIIEIEVSSPVRYMLFQNYPNPFNPTTKIKFSIPALEPQGSGSQHPVQLIIYDILGRKVATLVNERKRPGIYEIEFDASSLPSGVYIYRLKSDIFTYSKKMILLR